MPRYTVLYGEDGNEQRGFSRYSRALRFVRGKGLRLNVLGILNNKTGRLIPMAHSSIS